MRKSSTVMLLVVLVAVSAPDAVGAMKSGSRFVLDFTKPDAVKKQAAWSPADRLDITDAGLGWDGAANAWRDAWIQTTEPIAIGRSWRPVQYARVSAEIIPAGKFIFRGEHGMEFPSGILYVRHSPDAKHWSDWQVLKYETPRDKENPKQRYHGELRIPYRERGAYANLTRQYSKMDVPWKSDEEAAVRWIVKNDPKFFEKHRPFIGYLQFLFEISLRGSRRIEKISFDVSCGAGGMHSPPRDRSVYEERDRIPWRFKAEDVPEPPTEKKAEGAKRERLDTPTRAVLRRDAHEAFWTGDYAKTIAPCERLARAEDPTLDDLLWHGHAWQLSGNWEKAIAAYREALPEIQRRGDTLGGYRQQNWSKLVKVIVRLERDQLKDAKAAAATLKGAVKKLEASDTKPDRIRLEMLSMLADMELDAGNPRGAMGTWARLRTAAGKLERINLRRYIKIDREALAFSMLPAGEARTAFPGIIALTPENPDATLMLHEPKTRERSCIPKGPGNPYWRYAFAPPPGEEFETLRFEADIEQFVRRRGGHFRCFVQTEDASPGRRQLGSIHWPNDKELGRDLMGTLVEVPPGVRCVHIQTRSWEGSFNVYRVEVSATFRPATHNAPAVRADTLVQTEFLPADGEMTCGDRKLVSGRAYRPFLPGKYHLHYEVPGHERTFDTDLTVLPGGRHFIFVNLDSPFRWTQARPADLALRTAARASVQQLADGTCLAVWCGEGEHIMTCRTRDLVTWTEPKAAPFDNIFKSASPATFADADGTVWLAHLSRRTSFLDRTGGQYTLYLASTRDGKTWTTPRPVAVGTQRTGGARTVQMLRGPKGKHWIFCGEHAGCAPSIGEITKLTPITLEKEKDPYLTDPHVSVDEAGRFHMVFSHHRRQGILHVTSEDGRHWSVPTVLVEQPEKNPPLKHPQLVLRRGKAVLLYENIGAYMTPIQFGGRPLKPWESMKITGNVVPLMGARVTLTRDGDVLLLAGRTGTWLLRTKLKDLLGI